MTAGSIPRPAAGAPRPYHFPRFERRRLAGGVELVSATVTKLPLVSIVALVDAGAAHDPVDREGLAVLTAKLLLEGTTTRGGAALTEAFEQLGATVDVGVGWDSASITLTALRSNARAALALLSEVIRTPVFAEREIALLKTEHQAERMQMRTEPRELANESYEHFLYDRSARYAQGQAGSVRSVARLGRSDIEAFYRSYYVPARLTLIVVGDMEPDTAAAMAEAALQGWTGTAHTTPPAPARPASIARRVRIVAKSDAPQSELRIGHVGVPRTHPDYFPLVILNAVLGGLFSSRINLNLRERHGYAYGARSAFDWRRDAGPFVVSTAVESGVSADATREVIAEIDAIRQAPITAEELSLATSFLAGVFPIRFETTTAIANALAALVTYGYPADYFDTYRAKISGVTEEDVLQAARGHLHPERLLVVAVGDPGVIEEPLARLGLGETTVVGPDEIEPGA
jgi:zinc protease